MAFSLNYFESSSSLGASSYKSKSGLVQKIVPGPIVEGLVEASDQEKRRMRSLIQSTMSSVKIKDIKKVKNSFLEAMYLLKKAEYESRYSNVSEELLIHVTAASSVQSIIRNNFDWRRITRGKFGLGTSFSGDAEYANKYANRNIGHERAFIITQVLVSRYIGGSEGLKVPPFKYDTTTGNGSKVYVKFCDNEVLPQFVVYYNDSTKSRSSFTRFRSHDVDWDCYDYDDYSLSSRDVDWDCYDNDDYSLSSHDVDWDCYDNDDYSLSSHDVYRNWYDNDDYNLSSRDAGWTDSD